MIRLTSPLEGTLVLITAALWLLFGCYWAIAAVGIKRSTGGRRWRREIGLRVAALLVLALLMQSPALRHTILRRHAALAHSPIFGLIGVTLCFAGFALAMSARRELGRNWGMPMARKEDPDLITTGPYARIRHPIYTGLILALLGSAMVISFSWALLLVLVVPYFIYSARREESVMLQRFPQQYAAYRARTGMFLPSRSRHRQSGQAGRSS